MPRTLPWQTGSTTTVSRGKRSPTVKTSTTKRQKAAKSTAESGSEAESSSADRPKRKAKDGRDPSTSPPPEPPTEKFMVDGLEHDDKYRMVEDEFLTVAQKFTVHLHAAEYKRQQSLVKAQNADAINKISRPVTSKMPDQTRRKKEATERSKAQKSAIEGLVGKKSKDAEDTDDSDAQDLPYVGTMLHGFMDTPRKKAVSLVNVGSISKTTRAANGFKKPSTQKSPLKPFTGPQKSRVEEKREELVEDSEMESSGDDDLDLPIPAPKFSSFDLKHTSKTKPLPESQSIPSVPKFRVTVPKPSSLESGALKSANLAQKMPSSSKPCQITHSLVRPSSRAEFKTSSSIEASSSNAPPRLSRLEYTRKRKAKRDLEEEKNNKLDIIPTFL